MRHHLLQGTLLFLILLHAAGGEILFETDFTAGLADRSSRKVGSFSGVLPQPWQDNYTHFEPAVAAASLCRAAGGTKYLRLQTMRGAPQFACSLPELNTPADYRLVFNARNYSNTPAKVALRLSGPPYTQLAADLLPSSAEWGEHVLHFSVKSIVKQPVMLILYPLKGTLELKSLSLTKTSAAARDVIRPDRDLCNYFRNSRLPLGIQSGWNSPFAETRFLSTPDNGPSGYPSLRMEAWDNPDREIGLFTEPFQVPEPKGKYTVSFAARGKGNFRAEIIAGGKAISTLQLQSGTEFRRYFLDFQAKPEHRAFACKITGKGKLDVDAFRAAPAGEKEYRSSQECEVALALPDSPLAESRVQFSDESPELRFYVSGTPPRGSILRMRQFDLYGNEAALPDRTLEAAAGTVRYAPTPERPLGQFRIEAQIFCDGKAVSPPNEIVVTRLARPLRAECDAPDSPFGIHAVARVPLLKLLKAGGVNHVRLHDAGTEYSGWYFLEPEKGKWCFRDAEIERYRQNNLLLFAQLGTAPRFASYLKEAENRNYRSYFDRYFQPDDRELFGNYVRTFAERYRDAVDEYFIWNEPWNPTYFAVGFRDNRYMKSPTAAADFVDLCRIAREAARSVNPNARISGFNTNYGSGGETWSRAVLAAGGEKVCDMIDFHLYMDALTGFPGDAVEDGMLPVRIIPGIRGRQVYMSEGQGASLSNRAGDLRYVGLYRHTVPYLNHEDFHAPADKNARFLVSLLANGASRAYLYAAGINSLADDVHFRALTGADGFAHPMLVAHSALAARIEGKRFIGRRSLGGNLYAHLFSDGKRSCAAVTGSIEAKIPRHIPASTELSGFDLYGNPMPTPVAYEGRIVYLEGDANHPFFQIAATSN